LLKDSSDGRLGYINWDPFQPGAQVASRMAPALLAALALIGCTLKGALLAQLSFSFARSD
jgi:hypothetical protein